MRGPMAHEAFVLPPCGWVPNNGRLPVIVYRGAVGTSNDGADRTAEAFEALFAHNGWPPQWRNGVFAFHHDHATTHEVLGVAAGQARLLLGGPGGRDIAAASGDVLLLPAGTGHRLLAASPDFLVVGAYPPGCRFDLCRAAPDPAAHARMDELAVPTTDPVAGDDGPLVRLWSPRTDTVETGT